MQTLQDATRRGCLSGLVAMIPLLASRRANALSLPGVIAQPSRNDDEAFIERAFTMQRRALDSGDQGYGAVVVRDGIIVGQSPSRVIVDKDPTAHAEMMAIRDAARRLGTRDLANCILYSSSPACPMCEAAAYWAGIDRMVFGRRVQDGGRPSLC